MFKHLGRFTASHPWMICATWIVLGLTLAVVAPPWDARTQDDDVRFIPDRFTSVRAYQLLEKAFPDEVFATNAIFAVEREDTPLTEADFELVDQLVNDLEKLRKEEPALKLGKIECHKSDIVGPRLTSLDQHCTLIKVSLGTPFLALNTEKAVTRAKKIVDERVGELADAPNVYATGMAGLGRDLICACGESLDATTWATVILVIVVLLLVYRAPLLALIPLCSIAISVWVSLNVLALLTLIPGVHLVNISKIFAIVILYGAGTDYCLFLISRYRESLEKGQDSGEAVRSSVVGVGAALAASAGTVMVGLGLMAFAEFAKVRYTGPAIALSLGIALAASLTLTPALLRIMGKAVFWPRHQPSQPKLRIARQIRFEKIGLWDWISHGVAKRPILVWSVAVLTLMPLVIIGLRVQPNYRTTAELSPNADSLQGMAAIQRHFVPGEAGPVTVLMVSNTDWAGREGQLEIDHLCRGLVRLENIAEVRSLTQPLGFRVPDIIDDSSSEHWFTRLIVALQPSVESLKQNIIDKAKKHYVAKIDEPKGESRSDAGESSGPKYVTRLDLVLKSDPFSPESVATLNTLKTWLWNELPQTKMLEDEIQAEVFGVTANAQDLAAVTESDRWRVNTLVLIAIFAILMLIVRKPGFSIYLLLTVLLSYYASLGATVLAGTLWTGSPLPYVDWRLPFFLFVILVAVGEDYNIFLVSRAMEEKKRYGEREGMRRALARTGGPITSCGLIMAGTFATLMLAGLGTLMQIGFALAFGVLVDTFIVRPFLVPAFAMVFWKKGTVVQKPVKEPARSPAPFEWDEDFLKRVA